MCLLWTSIIKIKAANLTAHVRTHSGEKPFRCGICERRFSQSSSVTTHMRTHSGERPYRCRMCKKASLFIFFSYVSLVDRWRRHWFTVVVWFSPKKERSKIGSRKIFTRVQELAKRAQSHLKILWKRHEIVNKSINSNKSWFWPKKKEENWVEEDLYQGSRTCKRDQSHLKILSKRHNRPLKSKLETGSSMTYRSLGPF